nr:hypothetical protein [Tanacetum cinerariifolium]
EHYKNHRIQLLPIEHSAHVKDIVEFKTAIAQTFLYLKQEFLLLIKVSLQALIPLVKNYDQDLISFFIISSIAVQTPGSGISNLLVVGTTFTGNGNNIHWQWELILPVGTLSWQWECLVHFIPNKILETLLPSTSLHTLKIASTQALIDAVTAALPLPPIPPLPLPLYIPPPIDNIDDILETKLPPHKKSCLFALGPMYEVENVLLLDQPKVEG